MKRKQIRVGVTEAAMLHLIANEKTIDPSGDYARRKLWYARNAIGFYDASFTHSTEWGDNFLWETHCDDTLRQYFDAYRRSAISSETVALLKLSLDDAEVLFAGGRDNLVSIFSPSPVLSGLSFNKMVESCSGRRLIIVHSFAPLIESQIERGVVRTLRPDFVPAEVSCMKFPYCYFNSGPHRDSFETVEKIADRIASISDKDTCVVLGVGSQGVLVADKMQKKGIEAFSYGGDLQLFFGIMGNRWRNQDHRGNDITSSFIDNKPLWIEEIPNDLIPENSQKIEGACYW